MIDLKQMMDSVLLTECKKEIEEQLASIASHDNYMKRAVLLCFLGEAVLGEIAKENPERFIKELGDYLNKVAKDNKEQFDLLNAHVKENGSVIKNIDCISEELRELASKAKSLLSEYDTRLAEVLRARDNLPVCKL